MANQAPVYTLETSNGNKDFTTDSHHSQHNSIEAFLKAHEQFIKTLTNGAIIYGVIMSHHGSKTRLK